MGRARCNLRRRWGSKVRLGALFFISTFGLMAQPGVEAGHGAFEVTSGLGRKLYALPDDERGLDARQSLAADPKSVERILQVSKAEATRRQYREAVATLTQGLAFAPKNADPYLERGHRELGLREFRPAMNDLEQATRLAPEMLDAYYHLGWRIIFSGNSMRRQLRSTERERWRKAMTAGWIAQTGSMFRCVVWERSKRRRRF
jgi:tetratricopeptide (TPR) repeat protein